jgi:hypothetical protein
MTNEDKHEVCKYMKWRYRVNEAHVLGTHTDFTFTFCDDGWGRHVVFDLNDAALCVAEMQKRGDWDEFFYFVWNGYRKAEKLLYKEVDEAKFTALLFNADNFFKAFVEWRKGK